MECKSPAIAIDSNERIDEENGMMLDYGFIMDNVESVRDLQNREFSPFLVFPKPEYFTFEDESQVSLRGCIH